MVSTAEELEALYREEYLRFRHTIASVVGSDVAPDAVQEAFARALARLATYRGEGSLKGWVWRIALRTALELRRDRLGIPLEESFEPQIVDSYRDPGLAEAVKALPPRRRLIIFLRYFADLTYSEIAVACEISEGTVAATVAQGRSDLLRSLAASTDEVDYTESSRQEGRRE